MKFSLRQENVDVATVVADGKVAFMVDFSPLDHGAAPVVGNHPERDEGAPTLNEAREAAPGDLGDYLASIYISNMFPD